VDYGRLTAFAAGTGDEAATISLNGTAVCGDVCLIVYHARQHGALSKTTVGVRMCSLTFHTGSLPAGRPAHRWRLAQLDGVSGNEGRFSDRFRLVLNCVPASGEVSSREVVWPRPEARQLLFNSEQDYEATLRLVPRSRSKFFINNPGWGTGGGEAGSGAAAAPTPACDPDDGMAAQEESPPVAPPRAAARLHNVQQQNIAADSPSADCDDLLGLDSSLPPQQVPVSEVVRPVSPAPADLLVGLSPPAAASDDVVVIRSVPSETPGFDFLADFGQPAPSTGPSSSAQEYRPFRPLFYFII
jgi:hypothetical protein